MEESSFVSLINQKIKERGLTPKKLSELSGIPVKHLEELIRGNFHALPAAPYVRGYIERISHILGLEREFLWEEAKKVEELLRSGPEDTMPHNRFRLESIARYVPWIVALLILSYLGIRFSAIVGKPELTILEPREASLRTQERFISLRGNLSGATELLINGEVVPVANDGTWETRITLTLGVNTIEVTAKKFLGRETKILRQVLYELPTATSTATLIP